MRNLILFIVLTIATALLVGCKKDATKSFELPPISQNGFSTFGVNIGNKPFIPYITCSEFAPQDELDYFVSPQYGSPSNVRFSCFARNTHFPSGNGSNLIINMDFSDSVIHQTGDVASFMNIEYDIDNPYLIYKKFDNPNDRFIITNFDPLAKIISGTFEVTLYSHLGNGPVDSLKLTDGRFDLKIDTLYKRTCTD